MYVYISMMMGAVCALLLLLVREGRGLTRFDCYNDESMVRT
jgi:hypothetical protein